MVELGPCTCILIGLLSSLNVAAKPGPGPVRTLSSLQREIRASYATLGLTTAASWAEIRRSFHELSLQFHPDKCQSQTPEKCQPVFVEVARAYEILSAEARKKGATMMAPADQDMGPPLQQQSAGMAAAAEDFSTLQSSPSRIIPGRTGGASPLILELPLREAGSHVLGVTTAVSATRECLSNSQLLIVSCGIQWRW